MVVELVAGYSFDVGGLFNVELSIESVQLDILGKLSMWLKRFLWLTPAISSPARISNLICKVNSNPRNRSLNEISSTPAFQRI